MESSHHHLLMLICHGVTSQGEKPRLLSPLRLFPAPHGGPGGISRPEKVHSPSSKVLVIPEASYQLNVSRKLLKEHVQEVSYLGARTT